MTWSFEHQAIDDYCLEDCCKATPEVNGWCKKHYADRLEAATNTNDT